MDLQTMLRQAREGVPPPRDPLTFNGRELGQAELKGALAKISKDLEEIRHWQSLNTVQLNVLIFIASETQFRVARLERMVLRVAVGISSAVGLAVVTSVISGPGLGG